MDATVATTLTLPSNRSTRMGRKATGLLVMLWIEVIMMMVSLFHHQGALASSAGRNPRSHWVAPCSRRPRPGTCVGSSCHYQPKKSVQVLPRRNLGRPARAQPSQIVHGQRRTAGWPWRGGAQRDGHHNEDEDDTVEQTDDDSHVQDQDDEGDDDEEEDWRESRDKDDSSQRKAITKTSTTDDTWRQGWEVSTALTTWIGGRLWATAQAAHRALSAAFEADRQEGESPDQDSKNDSSVSRLYRTLLRMWQAVWRPPSDSAPAAKSSRPAKATHKSPRTKLKASVQTKQPQPKSSKATKSNSKTAKKNKKKKTKLKIPQQKTDGLLTPTTKEAPLAQKKEPEPRRQLDIAESSQLLDHSADLRNFLARSYLANPSSTLAAATTTPIQGGTFQEALEVARSQARLLLILIPASRPKAAKSADRQAVEGFLSAPVAAVAEKKSRKKKDADNTRSFTLWSAKAASPEAILAMKRLKVQQQGKRPVLAVAYPALVPDATTGRPKLVPKLLAQHHCHPPPEPAVMAAWLDALRKRHAKQYVAMQVELRETQMYHDRRKGYQESVQSDRARQEREKRLEEVRKAQELAEQERIEKIRKRREELRENLPEEPSRDDSNAKTISVRLPDGRSQQRRFDAETELSVLFDWVDVTFEEERETFVLSTMNGQKTFSWDDESDRTLQEVGLGRMTGLRLLPRKETPIELSEKTDKAA